MYVFVCVSPGVWSGHRHEHEAAFLGVEPNLGSSENAGPQTSIRVSLLRIGPDRHRPYKHNLPMVVILE